MEEPWLMKSSRKAGRWRLCALLAAGSLASLASGCGDSEPSGGSAEPDSSSPAGLSVVFGGWDPRAFIADKKGYFKRAGVNVTITDNQNANGVSLVTSGRADVAVLAVSTVMAVGLRGRSLQVLYGSNGGGYGAGVVAKESVDSLEALRAKGTDCTIGGFNPGTTSYGYTVTLMKNLGLKCRLLTFGDPPSVVGALTSGRADAVVGGVPVLAPAARPGRGHFILNPMNDPAQQEAIEKYLGPRIPEVVHLALPETATAKKDAIARYLRGMREADEFMNSEANREEVIELLSGHPNTQGQSAEQIEETVVKPWQFYTKSWGSKNGEVTEAQWDNVLRASKSWGIPGFDGDTSKFDYETSVTMDPLEASLRG